MAYVATGAAALGWDAADLDAINRYMMGTTAKTAKARQLQDDWLKWYDGLWFYERKLQRTYDDARNKRNEFDAANATSTAEQQAVQTRVRTGITTEEMQGQTRRISSEGKFPGSDADRSFWDTLPTWGKWAVGVTAVGGIAYLLNVRAIVAGLAGRKKH